MTKLKYSVCANCNGHSWLIWGGWEHEKTPIPFVEPCQFCNGEKPIRKPSVIRPNYFLLTNGTKVGEVKDGELLKENQNKKP